MKQIITNSVLGIILCLNINIAQAANPKVKMETSHGNVIIELYPEKAPKTVENFLGYVNDGSYSNTIFHRVIKDFMNQGGGFSVDYTKAATKAPIDNEADNGLKNKIGTVAMARTGNPHSATNQFFVNTKDNTFLDHTTKSMRGWGYTVFGSIIEGMEVMHRIADLPTGSGGPFRTDVPQEQVIILKMTELETKDNSTPEAPANIMLDK